jgi:hypothetical protein
MPIAVHFSRRLMNLKTTITLSTTTLGALVLLFATAPLAVTQAHAFWGGGWGHGGWGWHHPWWGWHHPWWGWHHGWGWGHGGFGGGWGHEGL